MATSLLVLASLVLGANSPQSTPPPPPSTQAPSKPPPPAPSTTPPAGPPTTQTPAPTKPAEGQTATPPAGQAPDAAKAGADAAKPEAKFDAAHLEQIVAPIALHPDGLLSQILMASTYPLEIVEAARWMAKNPSLKEKTLEDALKSQDWDASVKSLCGFQSVLKQMNENLDWTQDLGDAFLGQKTELMDAVQRMRKKALDAGTLKTTDQQKVSQDGQYIVVQSTNPEVIYVPTYSPTVVYGGWAYPTYYYPPMYAYPPAGAGFISFTAGVVWGAAIFGNCNWGHSDVDIDIDHNYNFENRTGDRQQNRDKQGARDSASTRDGAGGGRGDQAGAKGGKESFKHNPEHRKGVNYKDSSTASKFGGDAGSKRVSKEQARGYDRSGTGASGRNSASPSTRPSSPSARTNGAGAGSSKPSSGSRPSTSGAGASSKSRPSASSSGGSKSSAFSGSRNAGLDRAASSRGSASRSSGGGSRGGGGGRGGGGRGGGRR